MNTLSSKLDRILKVTDRIRIKTKTESHNIEDMASAVEALNAYTLGEASITENNTYSATDFGVDGLSTVNVNIPLDVKDVHENGVYLANDDNLAGYKEVYVNIPIGTKEITENGTYLSTDDDLAGYNEITVNIPEKSSATIYRETNFDNLPYETANVGDIGVVYDFTEASEGFSLTSKFNSFYLPKQVEIPEVLDGASDIRLYLGLADMFDENGEMKENYYDNYLDASIQLTNNVCNIDFMGHINNTEINLNVQYQYKGELTYVRNMIQSTGVECLGDYVKLPMDIIVRPDIESSYHEYMRKMLVLGTFKFIGIYRFEHIERYNSNYWVPLGSEQDL